MEPSCPFEPLARLARFSWDWAPALCNPKHGCVDYHRSWSLVRLLELQGAMPAGLPFFRRELGEVARGESRRVLISGGADTGLAALVTSAFRAHGSDPSIVFIDRCRTPCRQNDLFLKELGLSAQVQVGDASEVKCDPVDVVIAHSFLQFLPEPRRHEVVHAWVRVLKPGGLVLMSCALQEDESDWKRTKDADQIAIRRANLQQAAARGGFSAGEAAQAAATAARFWATSPTKPPALTEANVRALFDGAGMDLLRIDREPVDAVRGPISISNKETTRRSRGRIVAVRR